MVCPSCGSKITKFAGYSGSTRFLKCNDCELYFASPMPDFESLRKIYDSYVDDDWPKSPEEIEKILDHPVESDRFKKSVLREFSGRFLDVGFGSTVDLVRAHRLGFQVYGVEFSRSRLDFARNVLGFSEVLFGNLKEQNFPDEFFDVAMCWHVIEHVLDVDVFLDEVHRVLRPKGMLILGTENVEGLFPRLVRLKKSFSGEQIVFTSPLHTYGFTPSNLKNLLDRHDFRANRFEIYHPERWLSDSLIEKLVRFIPNTGLHIRLTAVAS